MNQMLYFSHQILLDTDKGNNYPVTFLPLLFANFPTCKRYKTLFTSLYF